MVLKESIRQILKRIPFPLSKNHLYDIQTRKILRRVCQRDSICVDVGCHRGEVLEWMIKYAPEAKHYGFEPIPKYAEYLKTNFGHTCHIFQYALGDKNTQSEFHFVSSNPSYSGIKKRRYDRADEKVEVITVDMRLLDDLIDEQDSISFIKIDVEGAEYWVLKGAIETIKKGKPVIVFETGLGGLDHYNLGPADMYDLICNQLGYNVSLMGSWLKKQAPLDKKGFLDQFEKGLNYYFVASPKEI